VRSLWPALTGWAASPRGRLPLQLVRQAVMPVVVVPAEHVAHENERS